MDVLVLTKIDGWKLEGVLNNKPISLVKSKFYEGSLEIGKEYEPVINEKDGKRWLNSVKPINDKKLNDFKSGDKMKDLKSSNSPMDYKQLLIMAQSCQHDAAQIISNKIDLKDYGSVEELANEVIKLRDVLLNDLVEKYYKWLMKFNPKTNEFEIKSKRTDEIYYIRLNPKTKTWICTCWKSANRPYEKWGYCNHILELLKKYDTKH